MNIWESLLVAIHGIKANKLRAILTMLGIIIGIASVITIAALGQGGRAMITKEFEKAGANLFLIRVAEDTDKPRQNDDLMLTDVEAIKKLVPEVTWVSAVTYTNGNIKGTKKHKNTSLIGALADFGELRSFKLESGRFFNEEDVRGQRRVVVLEDKLAREVMGNTDVLGKKVYINNVPMLVIGVIKTEDSMLSGAGPQIYNAYMPLVCLQSLADVRIIHTIEGKTTKQENVDIALGKALKILERRHDKKANFYHGTTLEKELATAKKITGIITIVFGVVAGISLLVGGIGVMNIMLVSVTERTREIGIRKALGAKYRDILWQFILEAVMICVFSGFIGILFGIAGAFAIAALAKITPLISWWAVLIAFVFSAGIGLFFGIYPANKAARMDPIEALRYE